MDLLFELLMDLIAEGTVALSKSVKVPKWIRYPLIGLIVLFCVAVIGVILITGWLALKESTLLGSILLALGIFLLVMGIVKFRKTYLTRAQKE